ncbi:hypothetical protein [Raoultella ornithinolytica]|uniref:hypothetical protein n=1 Tax=Raoultella ornithinolytica TaxID=54291 RepID=UPI00300CB04D
MNPWGPIIAAMIAGFIAFIGMIITKENKVSEFRQAWINEFREEISYLIEAYKKWTYNNALYKNHNQLAQVQLESESLAKAYRDKAQWYDQILLDAQNEMERYKGRIKLRLNSDISRRKTPENNLNDLLDKLNTTKDLTLADKLSKDIYSNSSLILSTEWKVVKKGEESYVKVKKLLIYLAVFLSIIAFVGFSFHLEEVMRWMMNNPLPLIKGGG